MCSSFPRDHLYVREFDRPTTIIRKLIFPHKTPLIDWEEIWLRYSQFNFLHVRIWIQDLLSSLGLYQTKPDFLPQLWSIWFCHSLNRKITRTYYQIAEWLKWKLRSIKFVCFVIVLAGGWFQREFILLHLIKFWKQDC